VDEPGNQRRSRQRKKRRVGGKGKAEEARGKGGREDSRMNKTRLREGCGGVGGLGIGGQRRRIDGWMNEGGGEDESGGEGCAERGW